MKLTFLTSALFITLTQAAILHNHIPQKARGGISRHSFGRYHTHASWPGRNTPRVKNAYETLLSIFNGPNAQHHRSAYYGRGNGHVRPTSGPFSHSQGATAVADEQGVDADVVDVRGGHAKRHGHEGQGRKPHSASGGGKRQDGRDVHAENGRGEGVNGRDGGSGFVVGGFRVGGNGQDGGNGLDA